jgi:predicted lipid carrier protein YhbT
VCDDPRRVDRDQYGRQQPEVMQSRSFPRPLSALFALLPQYPPAVAAAIALNLSLRETLSGTHLPSACCKIVTIVVRDAGLRLTFMIERDGIVACGNVRPDVTISATANDFLALALRRVDPDTLFFSRRLTIEGDTELGLLLKNTLDALGAAALKLGLPTPARLLSALRLQFHPRP